MMKKVIVSLFPVVGITALAIAAWVSYLNSAPEINISMQYIETETDVVIEETEHASEQVDLADDAADEPYKAFEKEDAYLLAKLAMAEAEGEDTEGKALVMLVVLNRVDTYGFPDTIREVIYQQGQFTPVCKEDFDKVEPDEDCWKALEMIETDRWNESMGATYFENAGEDAWHRKHLQFLFQHGKHYFYRE